MFTFCVLVCVWKLFNVYVLCLLFRESKFDGCVLLAQSDCWLLVFDCGNLTLMYFLIRPISAPHDLVSVTTVCRSL